MAPPVHLRTALDRGLAWVWYGRGASAEWVRHLLAPAAWAFGVGVRRRNARFDVAASEGPADVLPAVSVGNLTVGGTGKTPVASWFAAQLRQRGARPAIVLRGYGDDEWRVHALLTPDVPVFVSPNRREALGQAREAGCDCAVLDDAFQHRQVARVSDIVLVSADQWVGDPRLLPAGPFREPLAALQRASVVVITGKAAADEELSRVEEALRPWAGPAPIVRVRLRPQRLESVAAGVDGLALGALSHGTWTAVSAIGDPVAFEGQLRRLGARLVHGGRFPDHHAYTALEAAAIANRARGTLGVVCTLKDAVKLGPLWPRAAVPLWYVSQTLEADRGAGILERECDRVLAARAVRTPSAG